MSFEQLSEERGRLLFIKKCGHCHTIDKGEPHKMGPNLFGIMGKKAGTIEGFKYSEANKNIGITWTDENMLKFMENPVEFMPGTAMLWPKIKDKKDRTDILAFLHKFKKKSCCH